MTFIFHLNIPQNWQLENKMANTAATFMLYYLLFILLRTFILLFLSFIEFLMKKRIKEITTFPVVTILVPCYNEGAVVNKAVESIKEIIYPNLEILIIDDGSSDDTFDRAKELEKTDSRIRVIFQSNAGKSMALNNGISQSNGDFFVCMDADSVLSPNLLLDSIPFFEADPKLAAVAGAVEVGNTNNFLALFQKLEYIIGLNFHKMAQSCLSMVTIVPGPIGVFKKENVLKVGGYHTDTFAEDCDLSMRLLMADYNIKYTGSITAKTEVPDEINQLITQRYRWSRGMVQTILKSLKSFSAKPSLRSGVVITYMFLETIVIPLINFTFIIITLEFALLYGTTELMGPYFIGLTLLDLTLCLYSIIMEREITLLFMLGLFNRVTFGLAMEVVRFFSILDEVFNIPMTWGLLKRKGMGE
jgi:cellulose synthase/poly-beta-1,6-N-acetylglucosamine synthase-like glycosyltransferase